MATPLPRPRQVQIAGWLIIVGSLLTVAGAFDQVHALGSLKMAEEIEKQLRRPMFEGLGLSVDQIESSIKMLSIVSAVCATTMVVLAWQVLQQRSRLARGWLTALALPAFLTGMVGGGFLPAMVVVAVGLLWTQPAREWFAGTWKPEQVDRPRPSADRRTPSSQDSLPSRPDQVAAPVRPTAPGDAPQPPPMASWPPPAPHPTTAAAPAAPTTSPASAPVETRPGAVLGAAVLTWVFSVLCAIAFVTVMTISALDPDRIMSEMRRVNPELMAQEGVTEGVVQLMFAFLAGVVVLWAASACTLAVLVLRRVAWARIVLVVCAGAAALVLILAALASPVLLAPFAAAAATVGLLVRRDVSSWLTRS